MPIDTHKVKELTESYYGNATLKTGDVQSDSQQQKHLPPSPPPAPGVQKEQQKKKSVLPEEQIKHPILRNTLHLPENAVLTDPTEEDIAEVHDRFNIALNDREKRDLLAAGRRRYDMQSQLVAKAAQQQERPARRISLRPADAVKLSDASLISHFGEYTGQDAYLRLRYQILSNRYYALLPKESIVKLSRRELIGRLAVLYAAEPEHRNAELISFFEDLIRIRDFEESVKKKPKPAQLILDDAISEEERSKNLEFLAHNEEQIRQSTLNEREKFKRIVLMKKIMNPGAGADGEFLRESSIPVSPVQKEGIRQVLAWMYRNSCKTSRSKISFIHKLATAGPAQILLAMYLVEKGKQDAPSGDEFYEATHGYVPDLSAIKDRVVASKLKFWKRIGRNAQDSVINWSKIGSAVRYATESGGPENPSDVENFEKYTGEIADTKALLEAAAPSSEEKRDHLVQLLESKGNLILTYYRSAGLSPDMPIDMLPNTRMREEVQSLLAEISDGLKEVSLLSKELPDTKYQSTDAFGLPAGGESESSSAVLAALTEIKSPLSLVLAGDTGAKLTSVFASSVSRFTGSTDYGITTTGLKGVSALIGFVLAINSLIKLKSSPVLAGKGRLAQGLQSGADVVSSFGKIVQSGTDFIGKFTDLGSSPSSPDWYGNLIPTTPGKAFQTVSGGVKFTVGCVTILTGGVMTGAGALQLRRTGKMKGKFNDAQEALDQKGKDLSASDKQLSRFLSHEKRVIASQRKSAAVQTFSGTLTMIGGALTATGLLATLGTALGLVGIATNMGYGLYSSRHKKNAIMKAAVDEELNITTEQVRQLKDDKDELQHLSDDAVRDMIRQEELGKRGFATYKEYFSHCMKEFAAMLFEQVMHQIYSPDHQMYLDALKSLGMKVYVDQRIPTVDMIHSALMK